MFIILETTEAAAASTSLLGGLAHSISETIHHAIDSTKHMGESAVESARELATSRVEMHPGVQNPEAAEQRLKEARAHFTTGAAKTADAAATKAGSVVDSARHSPVHTGTIGFGCKLLYSSPTAEGGLITKLSDMAHHTMETLTHPFKGESTGSAKKPGQE